MTYRECCRDNSMGQVPIGPMVMPSAYEIERAWNYVKGKAREIRALPGVLHARQMEAAEVARQSGNEEARALVAEFGQLKLEATDLVSKMDSISDTVPGLGIAPAAVLAAGAVIVAIAWSAGALFRKKTERERELELLEERVLTPEQVVELRESIPRGGVGGIGAALAGVGDIGKWAVLGAVALFLLPMLTKGLK